MDKKSAIFCVWTSLLAGSEWSFAAEPIGSWTIQGIQKVNVRQAGVPFREFVFTPQSTYQFNADHTFSKGGVTGTWNSLPKNRFSVEVDLGSLSNSIEQALQGRGITFSHLQILNADLQGAMVKNGLCGKDIWKYSYDIVDQGKNSKVVESVEVSFVSVLPKEQVDSGAGVNIYDLSTNTGSFGSVVTMVNPISVPIEIVGPTENIVTP